MVQKNKVYHSENQKTCLQREKPVLKLDFFGEEISTYGRFVLITEFMAYIPDDMVWSQRDNHKII